MHLSQKAIADYPTSVPAKLRESGELKRSVRVVDATGGSNRPEHSARHLRALKEDGGRSHLRW